MQIEIRSSDKRERSLVGVGERHDERVFLSRMDEADGGGVRTPATRIFPPSSLRSSERRAKATEEEKEGDGGGNQRLVETGGRAGERALSFPFVAKLARGIAVVVRVANESVTAVGCLKSSGRDRVEREK